MEYPKIYLSLDNCFAIKRWNQPQEWIPLCKEIGFSNIEASFDNELDFLYSPDWYLEKWFNEVEELEKKHDVRVSSFFTGYQTYRTAGLGHPDDEFAEHILENWIARSIRHVGKRKNPLGFSFFSMVEAVLEDADQYWEMYNKIIVRLSKIGKIADENNQIPICVEAMYAPHQPPWTILGTVKMLQDIYALGYPIYTTIDVGHMIGQNLFRKPELTTIYESLKICGKDMTHPGFWLGGSKIENLWRSSVSRGNISMEAAEEIYKAMDEYSYMFADSPDDSDPYAWIRELGCYSPIMHLQQTDSITAGHKAFTSYQNKMGIIKGDGVLKALKESYDNPTKAGMPPKAKEIYLAMEIFAPNTEYPYETVEKLKETAAYWKQFIPKDGLYLDELVDRLN